MPELNAVSDPGYEVERFDPVRQEASEEYKVIQVSSRLCQERDQRALTSHLHVLSNMKMKKSSLCWVEVAR